MPPGLVAQPTRACMHTTAVLHSRSSTVIAQPACIPRCTFRLCQRRPREGGDSRGLAWAPAVPPPCRCDHISLGGQKGWAGFHIVSINLLQQLRVLALRPTGRSASAAAVWQQAAKLQQALCGLDCDRVSAVDQTSWVQRDPWLRNDGHGLHGLRGRACPGQQEPCGRPALRGGGQRLWRRLPKPAGGGRVRAGAGRRPRAGRRAERPLPGPGLHQLHRGVHPGKIQEWMHRGSSWDALGRASAAAAVEPALNGQRTVPADARGVSARRPPACLPALSDRKSVV